jgi:hypothetical protein
MTYTLTSTTTIVRDADNAFIPADPANTDYQQYLKWLDEGNTPNPYVPPPQPEPVQPTLAELQAQLAALTQQINALANTTPKAQKPK